MKCETVKKKGPLSIVIKLTLEKNVSNCIIDYFSIHVFLFIPMCTQVE